MQRLGPYAGALDRLVGSRALVADGECFDDEVAITPLPGSELTAEARCRVEEWAAAVGYRRLWFPDALVTLDPAGVPLGSACTRCSTCRTRFVDGTTDFWAMVRGQHLFPPTCPVCWGILPQWTPAPGARPEPEPAGAWDEVEA